MFSAYMKFVNLVLTYFFLLLRKNPNIDKKIIQTKNNIIILFMSENASKNYT